MSAAKGYELLKEQADRLLAIATNLGTQVKTEHVSFSIGRRSVWDEHAQPAPTVAFSSVPAADAQTWQTRARGLLSQSLLPGHYLEDFDKRVKHASEPSELRAGAAILRALVDDITDGHLPSISTQAHALTLSDLLDQADAKEHPGESVAAVMLAGGVLEAHLRFIGEGRSIPINGESSIGKWNEALFAATVYDKGMRSTIATWANLRNDADHLRVQVVDKAAVQGLIVGVRTLMQTHPR